MRNMMIYLIIITTTNLLNMQSSLSEHCLNMEKLLDLLTPKSSAPCDVGKKISESDDIVDQLKLINSK